eukprot:jgi/Botrbrau1/11581/Bobra.247_1s0002.1
MDPLFQTQALGGTLQHTAESFGFDFDASQTDYGETQPHFNQGNGHKGAIWDDGSFMARNAGGEPASLSTPFGKLNFEEGAGAGSSVPQPVGAPSCAEKCAYCGIQDPQSLVKSVKADKWFCNGRAVGTASCIITHLIKSKNRDCKLHPKSLLQEMNLECYACSNRNIFSLGFVPVKDKSAVVLLCREPHVGNSEKAALRHLDIDFTKWQAVVEERALCNWLAREPSPEELAAAKRLKKEDIDALEDAWKSNPSVKLEEIEKQGVEEALPPVQLQYADGYAYQNVMGRLVKEEADTDCKAKEAQARYDVPVEWDRFLNNRPQAKLNFPRDGYDLRLMPGDELRLKHRCAGPDLRPWEATGTVVRLEETTEKVVLEMRGKEPPWTTTVGYTVEFVWRSTSFDRQQEALRQLAAEPTSVSNHLYEIFMGHHPEPKEMGAKLPTTLSAPGLPDLNHSQASAVRSALQSPLSLIQGPPGTGKTVTAATVVYHLAQQEVQVAAKRRKGQILVAAPSNVAVDQLAEKIEATGLRVVRVSARAREAIASPVQHLTLHYQVANANVAEWKELRGLLKLREEVGELSAADERKLAQVRSEAERSVLAAADVICCTCVAAGDRRLYGMRFHRVLLDESTQATEAESLIPITKGAKQVVLIGDHCQLGPVIMSPRASKAGLGTSLFERLVALGHKPSRLAVQYRMHPALSRFPSDIFYEGALQNGVTAAQRSFPSLGFPWPSADRPMMFYSQSGQEEISPSGTSYLNRTESTAVEKLVTYLLGKGVTPDQIGVITPYEGQRVHIMSTMLVSGVRQKDLYSAVEVSSVDAFQGREKDFIIVSCVRASEKQGIGFLGDPRRLNVALTRAKYGLILVGNPKVLSQHDLWKKLLVHYKEHAALVEGPLNNLRGTYIQLAKPNKLFDSQTFAIGGAASSRFAPSSKDKAKSTANGRSSKPASGDTKLADTPQTTGYTLPPSQPLFAITQEELYATQQYGLTQGMSALGMGTQRARPGTMLPSLFADGGFSQGTYHGAHDLMTQGDCFRDGGTQGVSILDH